jgi:hypothetical protein
MSTHPNVVFMAALKPDDLVRKTFRAIAEDNGAKIDEGECEIQIGEKGDGWLDGKFSLCVMESDYLEGIQIAAAEGDLIIYALVTYGYGEYLSWAELEAYKQRLESWLIPTCEKHHCAYEIRVSANYW